MLFSLPSERFSSEESPRVCMAEDSQKACMWSSEIRLALHTFRPFTQSLIEGRSRGTRERASLNCTFRNPLSG